MAKKKKYYGSKQSEGFGMVKNQYANMPQEVIQKMYPKGVFAVEEGYYIDTEPRINEESYKTANKVRSSMKRNMDK